MRQYRSYRVTASVFAVAAIVANQRQQNEITCGISPAGDDTPSTGSDAKCRQTDRLNEVVERQLGGQLDYGDVEVFPGWWSVRLVDGNGGHVGRLACRVHCYLHAMPCTFASLDT